MITKLKWWQRLLCRWFCPDFEQDQPGDEPGLWMAVSVKSTHRGDFEVDTVEVEGLENAYEVARWLALRLDQRLHPDLGVKWAVRKSTPTSTSLTA